MAGVARERASCVKYDVADVWVTNHGEGTVEVWVAREEEEARLYGKNVNPEKEMNSVNDSMWFMCV